MSHGRVGCLSPPLPRGGLAAALGPSAPAAAGSCLAASRAEPHWLWGAKDTGSGALRLLQCGEVDHTASVSAAASGHTWRKRRRVAIANGRVGRAAPGRAGHAPLRR
ncbi:hypothetical protein PLESTB_001107100 [Pleodorina starrii]|uniref:Uncharacterized protein n=1 Tax=Pleodorina starrii TaxID=330485 RepID=A0A9W6F5G2_9CHLO|nr:hypothetical protein PLESTM_001342200 [Pleodorina starrii]GLC56460.1 hypothetical protein PLESTB_001107100 [Pleodorina starrii]GLC68960.1 hypothetical protein PLESTF_000763300 [Pleodorina starrii]